MHALGLDAKRKRILVALSADLLNEDIRPKMRGGIGTAVGKQKLDSGSCEAQQARKDIARSAFTVMDKVNSVEQQVGKQRQGEGNLLPSEGSLGIHEPGEKVAPEAGHDHFVGPSLA
jgi:hypothetical protein